MYVGTAAEGSDPLLLRPPSFLSALSSWQRNSLCSHRANRIRELTGVKLAFNPPTPASPTFAGLVPNRFPRLLYCATLITFYINAGRLETQGSSVWPRRGRAGWPFQWLDWLQASRRWLQSRGVIRLGGIKFISTLNHPGMKEGWQGTSCGLLS